MLYADISSVALSHIEAGQSVVKIDTLIRIAIALRVPLSSLQPADLDIYSEIPIEFLSLMPKLKKKSPKEQQKILPMCAILPPTVTYTRTGKYCEHVMTRKAADR